MDDEYKPLWMQALESLDCYTEDFGCTWQIKGNTIKSVTFEFESGLPPAIKTIEIANDCKLHTAFLLCALALCLQTLHLAYQPP